MKDMALVAVALVTWSIWGKPVRNGSEERVVAKAVAAPSQDAASAHVTEAVQYDGNADALIAATTRDYGVPGWYLYATWQIETGGNHGGKDGTGGYLAADMAKVGSLCERNKGREWCQRQWASLKIICAQTANDGTKACDAATVRTGWAFDSGPMQMLPTNIVKMKDGSSAWTGNAADYDGDGTVNPFILPDAMAMAAKLSRSFHGIRGSSTESWMQTTDRYRGGYIAVRRSKLAKHAATWCATNGCEAYPELLASK